MSEVFSFVFSDVKTKTGIKAILGHPKAQHAVLLLMFLTFSVILLSADIGTDFLAANEFFQKGHFYWGVFTLLPIFAPFLCRLFISLVRLAGCFEIKIKINAIRFSLWINDLAELFWHFPLLQPIRYCKNSLIYFNKVKLLLISPQISFYTLIWITYLYSLLWNVQCCQIFTKVLYLINFRHLRAFFALFMLDTSLASNYGTIQIIQRDVSSSNMMEAFLESAPQFILQCSIIVRTGIISKCHFEL